jgi:hypothetical protein
VNATTARCNATAAGPRAGQRPSAPASAPFAALPHDLRKDPQLRGQDKAVLLAAALLEYARGKASAWPSNRRLAEDLGCSPRTVQVALAALRRAGWVRVELGADTPTGRRIVLVWREADCAPSPRPIASHPAQHVAPGERSEEKENRPSSAACCESTPPPAGEKVDPGAPPSAEDLERFHAWATGPDPALARFGRAALRLAGADPDADEKNTLTTDEGIRGNPNMPAVEPGPTDQPISPIGEKPGEVRARPTTPTTAAKPSPPPAYSQGTPRARTTFSPAQRRDRGRGPRQILEGLINVAPAVLPVRAVRSP